MGKVRFKRLWTVAKQQQILLSDQHFSRLKYWKKYIFLKTIEPQTQVVSIALLPSTILFTC